MLKAGGPGLVWSELLDPISSDGFPGERGFVLEAGFGLEVGFELVAGYAGSG